MANDPAVAGYGVIDGPPLPLSADQTVLANLSGGTAYPTAVTLAALAAAMGATSYQGTWNASTNTPTLTSSVGTNGQYYVVSVAGTTNLNGITDWSVGDWAIFNSTAGVWQKVEGGATTMTVGTTLITGGTNTRILRNNAGVLGEYTITGTGTVVAMQTGASLIAPALGVATATSLAIGGATIGSNALAVTGPTALGGSLVMGAATSITVTAGGIIGVGFALDQNAAGDISSKATGRIGFSSTSNPGLAPDSMFSRISAGVIGVGTGTQGSIAGGMQMATLALGGATIGANALAVTGAANISGLITGGLGFSSNGNNAQINGIVFNDGAATRAYLLAKGTSGHVAWGNSTNAAGVAFDFGTTADKLFIRNFADNAAGALEALSYQSGAPSGGTAAAWKLGVKVDAVVVFDTAKYLQVDIAGTAYKVALAS